MNHVTGQRRRSRAITGLPARLGGRSWGRRRWLPRHASRGHRQPPRREHLADVLAEVVGGADPTPLLLALHQSPPQEPAEPRVPRTAFDLPDYRLDRRLALRVVRPPRRRRDAVTLLFHRPQ